MNKEYSVEVLTSEIQSIRDLYEDIRKMEPEMRMFFDSLYIANLDLKAAIEYETKKKYARNTYTPKITRPEALTILREEVLTIRETLRKSKQPQDSIKRYCDALDVAIKTVKGRHVAIIKEKDKQKSSKRSTFWREIACDI